MIENITFALCQKADWKGINETILDFYELETKWLCPEGGPIKIRNTKKNIADFIRIRVLVDTCLSYDYCYSDADIQDFINSYARYYGHMTA